MLIVILTAMVFIAPVTISAFISALSDTPEDAAESARRAAKEMEVIYKYHPHLKKQK